MTQKQIVEKCHEKGINYSFMHIYRIGLREGFFIKNSEDNFDEEKFNKWLNEIHQSIPEDCMYIVDAVKEYNIHYRTFTYFFNKYNLGMFKDDIPHNRKFYAKKSDIIRVVESHNRNNFRGKEQDA